MEVVHSRRRNFKRRDTTKLGNPGRVGAHKQYSVAVAHITYFSTQPQEEDEEKTGPVCR